MLGSGAPLPQALAAAREAVALEPHRALLERAEAQVVAGGTLATALGHGQLIDPTALAMIEAGEEADDLRAILDTATTILAEETTRTLTQAIRTLTPVLTLTIAFGVGAIILTTISAIMDLNDIAF
jgi:general secretion pathway protein F